MGFSTTRGFVFSKPQNQTKKYPKEILSLISNAQDNLVDFIKFTKPDFKPAPHHELICKELEAIERGETTRLIIEAPPRHGKSELCSRRFPAYYLGKRPSSQVITASYGGDLATDFGWEVRSIVGDDYYRVIFPSTSLVPDSKASQRWRTSQGGIYIASGIGGPIGGRGAHLLVIDDPVKDREEADSPRYRDRAWNWYTNVAYPRLMPGGAIVVITTRWHEDDLVGRILEQEKSGGDQWKKITLRAIAEYGDVLGRLPGEALWPEWFDLERLGDIRTTLTSRDGPRAWEALYQQRPQAEEGSFFKSEWFQWYLISSQPKYLTIYGASDYAVTAGGGDYTVHGIIGVDPNDDIYVLDWWRAQTDSAAWVEAQVDLAEKWRPVAWAVEKGQIEKGVGPFLDKRLRERKAYIRLEPFTSGADKATRAQSIAGRMAMGKVYFPKDAKWTGELQSEMLRFGTAVHDDQVDVMSLFGRMLNEMYAAGVPADPSDENPALGANIIQDLFDKDSATNLRYG
jgi:predicted phage terminase large subunit-like protein